MNGLSDRLRGLLRDAEAGASEAGIRASFRVAIARMDEPLRVAIAGRVKAGKSTLFNAMELRCDEDLAESAPSSVRPSEDSS